MLGLSGVYRHYELDRWTSSGEAVYPWQHSEWAAALDGQFLVAGFLHATLRFEYAPNRLYNRGEQWEFFTIVSLGVLFGLDAGEQSTREP